MRAASALIAVVLLALTARSCLGPAEVTVPIVDSGSSVDAATALLSTAKLDAVRTTQASKTVLPGRVVGIDPKPGTKLHEGDHVTLFVSSGRPKVTLDPASYVGQSLSAVRASLLGLGLVPVLAFDGSGPPAGTVSGVSPAGSVSPGSTVTVHVVPTPGGKRKKHGGGGEGD